MLSDRDVLALTLYGEARGEPTEGRIAVACVIRNRVRQPGWWGEGVAGVCQHPLQFSCWNAHDPNRPLLDALAEKLAAGAVLADPILLECQWIADGILSGRVTDRVGHATHYFATSIAPPAWTAGATLVARVGSHLFYSHVT